MSDAVSCSTVDQGNVLYGAPFAAEASVYQAAAAVEAAIHETDVRKAATDLGYAAQWLRWAQSEYATIGDEVQMAEVACAAARCEAWAAAPGSWQDPSVLIGFQAVLGRLRNHALMAESPDYGKQLLAVLGALGAVFVGNAVVGSSWYRRGPKPVPTPLYSVRYPAGSRRARR